MSGQNGASKGKAVEADQGEIRPDGLSALISAGRQSVRPVWVRTNVHYSMQLDPNRQSGFGHAGYMIGQRLITSTSTRL